MRLCLSLLVLTLSGCAASQTCARRADEAYRMCQQAPFQPLGDPESQMLESSDEQQMCRARYQQAMSQCPGGGGSKVKTSTISPIPTLDG